ncbi:MAG: flagellin FliC [Myxococcales bacterium]|nr:flagellin FliC [Myxococcales bacterium]
MPSVINTNVPALEAQRNLGRSQAQLSRSFQRLSSGFRINSAADDAAGLAVSETITSHIRSYGVAERNTNNAISMAQTAESGLGQISGILIRMRELAVQSANGDLTSTDRSYLNAEFQKLKEEIDRLAQTTEFNGKEMLAGATLAIDFQVGINTTKDDVISMTFGGVSLTAFSLTGATVAGSNAVGSLAAINAVDAAFTIVNTRRAEYGAQQNRLEVAASNSQAIRTNLAAANSRIRDVDVAEETSTLARTQVLIQAGTSVLAQANAQPQVALSLLQG